MRGTLVMFLEEFLVVLREIGRGRKNGVEFSSDDFLDFAIGWFGLCTEGVSETDGLLMGGWI